MINSAIVRIVDTCAHYRWTTIIAGILLMLGAGAFAAARFSINTDDANRPEPGPGLRQAAE